MSKLLIVAQVPPPYHGQAVMQKYLVDARWDWCTKHHIPLEFSEDIAAVGRFRVGKVAALARLYWRLLQSRGLAYDLVYYPPSAESWTGLVRDLLTLPLVRRLAPTVVFHFHAGGFDRTLQRLPGPLRSVARWVYGRPDLAIVLSPSLRDEVERISPRQMAVIPNGIPDVWGRELERERNGVFRVLFVGAVSREKGVDVLVSAVARLRERGYSDVHLDIVGDLADDRLGVELTKLEATESDWLHLHGRRTGRQKWTLFERAHAFCFPTRYPRENQPVAVIEAMMASLPIVATDWRAVPDLVHDGVEGLIIPHSDVTAVEEALEALIDDPVLASELGKRGRIRFEKDYSVRRHLSNIEEALKRAAEPR